MLLSAHDKIYTQKQRVPNTICRNTTKSVIAFLLVMWAVCYGNQHTSLHVDYLFCEFFSSQCILCDNAHNPPIGSDATYRFNLHTALEQNKEQLQTAPIFVPLTCSRTKTGALQQNKKCFIIP